MWLKEQFKRLIYSLFINLIPRADQRARFMKRHKIFAGMEENVNVQFRKIPLYPQLIKFHNNIVVASNVLFVTHDAINVVVNRAAKKERKLCYIKNLDSDNERWTSFYNECS